MGLADYQPETRAVPIGGGQTVVVIHGLSITEVTVLVREHFPDLDAIFDLFEGVQNGNVGDITPILLSVISQAPGFAANVIALAANEPDATRKAEQLPLGVQVDALQQIFELTFTEAGSVGKAWGLIAQLLTKRANVKKMLTKGLTKTGG